MSPAFDAPYTRGRRRTGASVVSLVFMLAQQAAALERKPPVTLLLVAAQVLFFLRLDGFEWVPSTRAGCLLPSKLFRTWYQPEWSRFFWSPWLHADALHLYYNMSSLIWKGSQLEPRLGSLAFARLVAELALTSNALYCGVALLLSRGLPLVGWTLMRTCAVGFSGVLFGMKVVLNHSSPGWSEVYGVRLPTKYVCWAELFLMQLLVPEASFTGHLCGILAGLLYVLVTSRLPFLPGGSSGGRGQRRRGAGGGRRNAAAGGGALEALLRFLFGGGGRRRARTYGHGTWGGSSAGAGAGASQQQRGSGARW